MKEELVCMADIQNKIYEAALPDMPVTDRTCDVGRFILANKNENYFKK